MTKVRLTCILWQYKVELTNEQIQPINTQNTVLILQQNKELVEHTNKLNIQLSKSYTAINRIEELKKENTVLRHENEKFYKTGFSDAVNLITKCLYQNMDERKEL